MGSLLILAFALLLASLSETAIHPELCVKGCECKGYTVRCMFLGIKSIPGHLPEQTKTLDLRFNQIRHIPRGAFKNLSNVTALLLNNNELKRLKNRVFHGLDNLQYLYLYKNMIVFMEKQVFQDLPRLEHLYLHYNKIKVISPQLFQGLPRLSRLFLYNNSLEVIPTAAFADLPALKRLRVDQNPLHCDCRLKWFLDFAHASSPPMKLAAVCHSPPALARKPILELKSDDEHMICDGAHFVEEPSDADVVPGGAISFVCRVEDRGRQVEDGISWSRNNVPLGEDEDEERIEMIGNRLVISDARPGDVGVYKCHVGSLTSRSARVRFYQGRAKPIILHQPRHTEVEKGSTIRLSCVASGFPRPSFAWFKDGGRLSTAHSRYKIEENGTLVITNAQLGDSGHYRCSASNYLGRASSAARVKVNLNIPEAAPQMTTLPRDAKIREESFVEFTCVASGQPYPDLSWWKNNRLVDSDGRIQVSNGGQHLRIEDVRSYDAGDYTCRAENRLGRVEASAKLAVSSKPRPLELIVMPHDMIAPKGTTIQMPCRAQGSPSPTIKWLKDGHEMNSPRFDVRPDGSLVVQNVSEEDEGMYQCVADNGVEQKTAEARFAIRKPREAHGDEEPEAKAYQIGRPTSGDEFVLIALEEATLEVDKALNHTLETLFDNKSLQNSTPSELLRVFRYPPENQRGFARAAEIYERTLELVALKVKNSQTAGKNNVPANFTYQDLLSPINLELLANLSGCEAHRAAREVNCTQDMCFHSKYRSVDGTCNNFQRPLQGASSTTFKRLLPANYENLFNTPMGWSKDKVHNGFRLPNAREVSGQIISTTTVSEDDQISHMVMQWGQFLDHDLDHSMEAISRETFDDGITCGSTCENRPPCFPIQVDGHDSRISSGRCMEFTRSSATCGSGSTSVFFHKLQRREQLNQLTSYLDASQVYGSSLDLAISLRNLTNDFGRLREGLGFNYGKPLLPFNTRHLVDCRRDPRESNIGCFLAGDVRANEQLGLISMHTLWFRQHNRLATVLRQLNPHWDGDKLYEETRKIVGAQMQHITYKHWLPLIIGDEGMNKIGPYQGYRPDVDASVSNVFAASAFRFGHTLVQPVMRRLDRDFESIPEGDLALHQAFFAPWRIVQEGGIDPIVRGLFASPAKKNLPHELMNEELTQNLFGAVHSVALDLGALNIQRGRDHGLPSYVKWRMFCGLDATEIGDWSDLGRAIGSPRLVAKLQRLYGHPGNIDLWVGGLLERPVAGARVGATVQCLLIDQFRRLRDGDRFWYENPSVFASEQLSQIRQSSLTRIVCDNGDDIHQVFPNVFEFSNNTSSLVSCDEIPQVSLNPWHDGARECDISSQESRVRRSAEEDESDPMEERLEGLETVIMRNKLEMKKIKRRLTRVYAAMVQMSLRLQQRALTVPDAVCIDYQGSLRHDKESWTHRDPLSTSCARCICQRQQIQCQKTECA